MGWTDERVELLKKLWADGLSASQIAAELGGITRGDRQSSSPRPVRPRQEPFLVGPAPAQGPLLRAHDARAQGVDAWQHRAGLRV